MSNISAFGIVLKKVALWIKKTEEECGRRNLMGGRRVMFQVSMLVDICETYITKSSRDS